MSANVYTGSVPDYLNQIKIITCIYLFCSCLEGEFFLMMKCWIDCASNLFSLCELVIKVELVTTEALVNIHGQAGSFCYHQLTEEWLAFLE